MYARIRKKKIHKTVAQKTKRCNRHVKKNRKKKEKKRREKKGGKKRKNIYINPNIP